MTRAAHSLTDHRWLTWLLIGLASLAWLVGCSSSENDSAASTEPIVEATSEVRPPVPSLAVQSDPEPAPEPIPEPAPEPIPEPAPEPIPEPTLLLPGDGWQVAFMHSDVWPPSPNGSFALTYAGTEAGVWGPVAEASFVPSAGYRDIGNRGTPYHDVVTKSGAPARVRTEFAPYSITAVLSVDKDGEGTGSIVVTSYDLTEADLLVIVDGIAVNDLGVVVWDEDNLPAGLRLFEREATGALLTQYQLQRGDGESLSLMTMSADDWQMPLRQRLMHAESEFAEVAGQPALIYGYDPRSRDDAGAVYTDGELFYFLNAGPAGPSSSRRTIEEIAGLLQSLDEVPIAEIAAELGLLPRAEVLGAWIDETPLPEGTDLTWMLHGPPVDPEQEAFKAHQVFACAWVGEWIDSGDAGALDEVQSSDSWPTTAVINLTRESLSLPVVRSIDAAREITSLDDRRRSSLALDCSFLLGSMPQD